MRKQLKLNEERNAALRSLIRMSFQQSIPWPVALQQSRPPLLLLCSSSTRNTAVGNWFLPTLNCPLTRLSHLTTQPNPFASKCFSKIGADSFSPQGVRSVGPRLFENLTLQVSFERRSCLWATRFRPAVDPAGAEELPNRGSRVPYLAHRIDPIGFVFSNLPNGPALVKHPNRRLGLFFTKPLATARLGSLRRAANQPLASYFQTYPMAPP